MAAVDALRARTRRRAVYALGHSMGGMTALFTAALDSSITGTIAIATGYGRPTSLERYVKPVRPISVRLTSMASTFRNSLTGWTSGTPRCAQTGRPAGALRRGNRDAMVNAVERARAYTMRAPEPKTFATIDSDHTYAGELARDGYCNGSTNAAPAEAEPRESPSCGVTAGTADSRGRPRRTRAASRCARASRSGPAVWARRRCSISPRPASGASASSTTTSSTKRTCSARRSSRPPMSGATKAAVAARASARAQSAGRRRRNRAPFARDNARELVRALRCRPRLHRSLSDALPDQRCVRAGRQARRLRLDLSFRRTSERLSRDRRPMLSMPLSRAAAAGSVPTARRRRARRIRRHRRRVAGERSAETASGHRRSARRTVDARRSAWRARVAKSASSAIRAARSAATHPDRCFDRLTTKKTTRAMRIDEVEPEELDDALESAMLLDVREPNEARARPARRRTRRFPRRNSKRASMNWIVRVLTSSPVASALKSRWAAQTAARGRVRSGTTLRGGLLAYAAAPSGVAIFLGAGTMQHKAFGTSALEFPVIGQGTWDVPESGARLAKKRKRALRRGIELGMTHLDTAEMYGCGTL